MGRRLALALGVGLALASFFPPSSSGQRTCQPPPAAAASGRTIFTDPQENDLGDAIAESLQRNFRVIDDEDYTGYLQRVGDRLLKHVPPNELHFRFMLFDLPTANAFSLPGGRILVSRKLVAFTRSEDELAGILGHEIGHSIVHESAAGLSRAIQIVLGITQLGDRQDVYDKYNQFIDNVARKRDALSHGKNTEDQAQLTADHIAIYAMAAAGYDPNAFSQFWDRFAETKGKTGDFFSDLFGTTSPESRRLRDMLKAEGTLPQACIDARQKTPVEEYQKWQVAVVNYSGLGHKESLHAVLYKKALDPPLRSDLTNIRFSPDGKYILAQNDSMIYVLTHQPFAILFQFDAPDAYWAHFTPDSQSIVFYDHGLRVESWSVADQARIAAYEVVIQKGCLQTRLSPDGKTLACYNNDFDLSLIDVASGTAVFQKKEFYVPNLLRSPDDFLQLLLGRLLEDSEPFILNLAFSPDGRYFVASSHEGTSIAVDMTTHTPIPLKGPIKSLLSGRFTFIAPDRIVAAHPDKPDKSGILEFPSGDMVADLVLGKQDLSAPGHGNFLLLRPIEKYPLGVMNLETKKIFMANKRTAAFDIYDTEYVGERLTGELGLYAPTDDVPHAKVSLPRSPLSRLRATALSRDLRWLAVSERTRGGVWDLQQGQPAFQVRGFNGAYFGEDGKMYADFPKFEKTDRSIATVGLADRQVNIAYKIEESRAHQHGPFLILTKPAKKDASLGENVTVEVHDARTSSVLWSRHFPKESPTAYIEPLENSIVLVWHGDDAGAKNEISTVPELAKRLANARIDKNNYLLEVLEARTGNVRGGIVLETGKGSFRLSDTFAVGEWLVVTDNANRTLLYSIATGEQKGKIFGRRPIVSGTGGLLCVENDRGQLSLYDLATMKKRDQFVFTSPISMMQFAPNGKRLFVLTSGQTAYLLDVSGTPRASAANP